MPRQKTLTRAILALAWPAIAVNITTPLLSLVDVAVVGHIGNSVYIAAITLGATMFNTLYWLFGFLRMGTSGLTAQAWGAGDRTECVRVLGRALVIAAVAAVLMMVLAHPIGTGLLAFLDDGDVAQAPALTYFKIAILGAPGVFVTYALSGWFLGTQDSRPILWMALVANTLNIGLNLIFVFGFGLGIRGVAAATAIAQWAGALFGLVLMWRRLHRIKCRGWRTGLLRWRAMRRLFVINTDIFLRTLCLVAVTLWFTHAGAGQGVLVLSANALLMQLFMLFSYFMDGFAFAGEALAGRFAGSRNKRLLSGTVRQLAATGLVMALLFTAIYFFGGSLILGLLTDDGQVLAMAAHYDLWAVAVPLAGFMSFLWDGIYIGLTRTRMMLLCMVAAMVIFFAVYLALYGLWQNNALWLAFILYLATRSLLQTLLYPRIQSAL